MNSLTVISSLSGLFLTYFIAAALFLRWHLQCRQDRPPVRDKLMRAAGERLRQRLDVLDRRTHFLLLAGTFTPLLILLAGLATVSSRFGDRHPGLVLGLTIGLFVVLLAASTWSILRTLNERRDARRALLGERIVAENLDRLTATGHHVFHDIPTENRDPIFNLHHVVVGPAGIFAIETKTLKKRRTIPGRKEHEIVFDGDQIVYPWGQDVHGLGPARFKSNWLSDWIYQITGQRLTVIPVLTFPGWWVNSTTARDVRVHNPRQLSSLVRHAQGAAIDPNLVEIVADHLETLCRDVEL